MSIPDRLALAIGHHQNGRWDEAESIYQHILALQPEHADALHLSGLIAYHRGDNASAVALIARAIRVRPAEASFHYNLGVLLQAEKQLDGAAACYRQALSLKPGYLDVFPNLGAILHEQGRLDEALACYRQALALKPDYAEAYCNMGFALQAQGETGEAIVCYRQALALKPDYAEARCNLGFALSHSRPHDSIDHFRQALALRPDYADARFNLALVLLRLGYFEEGWQHFEARSDRRKSDRTTIEPELDCPQWSGEDLCDKSLVIWPEQGMGDEIQCVRYISRLKALGAAKVTLVCKDPLRTLFGSVSGVDAVIAKSAATQLEHHDYWAFPMSLPLHFKTRLENIPAKLPYLSADSAKIGQWSSFLPASGIKVGLVWKGSVTHKNDRHRSLPGLSVLAPLWSVAGMAFVSLQKGQGEEEAANPPAAQPLIDLGSRIEDFSDTAAIMSQLDLIICVDTAAAHLAGALGKPCWMLLPHQGSDWRWQDGRTDTPWYPGVMRLFRQSDGGGWGPAVAGLTAALEELKRNRAAVPSVADNR
ncbi:MAG TPA: tetratricopeptide repeat-containing glycosyltransferase family protein [Burkholderiales bacterium]|nr:tetratricopeptide repeat-containing glycosyltransferase family protein [Burkholderiales bacterium]